MTDWADIGRRLGMKDAEGFVRREITPLLHDAPVAALKKNGERENRLETPMGVGFFTFVAAFLALNYVLPDTLIANVARFVLFPLLLFAALGAAIYFYRDRFLDALAEGKSRFIIRSKALTALADELDIEYAPSPGGAPTALAWVAKQNWVPAAVKDAAAVLDAHGGMDSALEVVRRSGVLVGDVTVLGSQAQKEKYLKQSASMRQIEDGFHGERGGVPFSAFEWIESESDAPDVYHLAMVFSSPHRLYGVTQLRSRHISWPSIAPELDMGPVGIVAPAFENRFRMRASDQVEARLIFDPLVIERVAGLAHGEKVRAVAFDEHLVIDVEGEDRFAMIDLVTGAWSDETIAASMANIADMLALADAVAHAFKLRAAA